MKHTTLYGDDFEDRMGSALGGMGMLYLGIGCVLNHIDLDKVVPPDGLLTTAQVIELVGVPALSGLLGCAIGAALNQWVSAHTEPVLRASEQAVRRVDFTALPQAIGNTKRNFNGKIARDYPGHPSQRYANCRRH